MHEPLAATGTASSSDICVRGFRQILICPLQITPQQGKQDSAHWERLFEFSNSWIEDAGDFTGDGSDFDEDAYAEFIAFMPDVQRFLYGEGKSSLARPGYGASPIRIFRRRDVAAARVTLRPGQAPIQFHVARVEIYFFYDIDTAILVVELAGNDLTLGQAQDMLFLLGRAYPRSWEPDGSAAHCCEKVEWLGRGGQVLSVSDYGDKERYLEYARQYRATCMAAHWAFLLQPLAMHHGGDESAILYRQLEYQRFPLMAWLAVDDPYRISRNDWMRLGLAAPPDPAGSPPLAAGFLADFESRYCYDRFWDGNGDHAQTSTRILCSGQVCIMAGEADSPAFTDAGNGILAQFRHQYFLLGLIAHFNRATLVVFRDRLVTAMTNLDVSTVESVKSFKREIRRIHENFLRFTHRYWFQEVSNQAPARDLFRLWVGHLGTDALFEEVRQDVQSMNEYLDSDGLRRQANSVVRLTVVTFFGLIGTVATGFLGMNLIDLTQVSLLHKLLYLLAVLIPTAFLTLYTAAKAKRLADFLETVSDERKPTGHKVRAFFDIWRR